MTSNHILTVVLPPPVGGFTIGLSRSQWTALKTAQPVPGAVVFCIGWESNPPSSSQRRWLLDGSYGTESEPNVYVSRSVTCVDLQLRTAELYDVPTDRSMASLCLVNCYIRTALRLRRAAPLPSERSEVTTSLPWFTGYGGT